MRTLLTLTLAVVSLSACGPSAAELKAARDARYKGPPAELFAAAERAAVDEHYKIGDQDTSVGAFATIDKWYGREGDARTTGAGDTVQLDDGSIQLAFVVRFVGADGGAFTIDIEPVVHRYVSGRSNFDNVEPGDPTMPTWVMGKEDALRVAIHDHLKQWSITP